MSYNDYSEVRLSVDLNQFAAELTEEILSRVSDQIDRAVDNLDLSYAIEEAISDADIDGRIESVVRYDMSMPDEDDVARIAAEQAVDVFRDEGYALVRDVLANDLPGALRELLLSLAAPPAPAPAPAPEATPPAPAPLQVGDRVLVSGPITGAESSFPRHGQACTGTVRAVDELGGMLVELDVRHPYAAPESEVQTWSVWIDPSQAVRHA